VGKKATAAAPISNPAAPTSIAAGQRTFARSSRAHATNVPDTFSEPLTQTVTATRHPQRPPADRDRWPVNVHSAPSSARLAGLARRAGPGPSDPYPSTPASPPISAPISKRRSRSRRTWCGSAGSIPISPTTGCPVQRLRVKIESQVAPDSCQTAGLKPPLCASCNSGRRRVCSIDRGPPRSFRELDAEAPNETLARVA